MYHYGFPWFGFGGLLGMILFWVFVVILIAWVVRRPYHYSGPSAGPNPQSSRSALDVLNERYAKGEINKQEYDQKKKDIMA